MWDEDWNIAKFIRDGNGIYDPDEAMSVFGSYTRFEERRLAEAEIFINGYK